MSDDGGQTKSFYLPSEKNVSYSRVSSDNVTEWRRWNKQHGNFAYLTLGISCVLFAEILSSSNQDKMIWLCMGSFRPKC